MVVFQKTGITAVAVLRRIIVEGRGQCLVVEDCQIEILLMYVFVVQAGTVGIYCLCTAVIYLSHLQQLYVAVVFDFRLSLVCTEAICIHIIHFVIR